MPRALVIDDEPHVRTMLADALERHGFEVDTADDGLNGVTMFQRAHFDVVVVDLYMPRMDGTKAIKTLRSLRPALPIIAISGHLLPNGKTALEFLRAARGLFSDITCLEKPFRAGDLVQAVQQALGNNA